VSDTLPLLLTPAEVGELLRTSVKGVYTMRDRGMIPGSFKLGRKLLFRRDEVLSFVLGKVASSSGRK
jgi:excisionase family DNA binding protein